MNVWLAILVAILAGAAFGVLQGLVIVMGAPSFMVTLGASIALSGLLLIALPETGSIDLSQTAIRDLTLTFLTPATSWLLLVLVVAALWLLKGTERGPLRPASMLQRGLLVRVVLMLSPAASSSVLQLQPRRADGGPSDAGPLPRRLVRHHPDQFRDGNLRSRR
jgi:ABC-type xylose transport system permease subunit